MTDEPLVLDERGRRCPLPVISLGQVAAQNPGSLIEVYADDPAADHDIAAWCRLRSAHYLGVRDLPDSGRAHLVRAPESLT
jgi:TusA-related sulfurtransferase